jgi:2-polyprenyl-6-methoxyphenol hydroxylase-like FAD-dependent oxidoreductase
MLTVEV